MSVPRRPDPVPQPAAEVSEGSERRTAALPDPSVLQRFEDVEDGFANRIMTMVEDQLHHRIELENRDARRSDLGLVAGFVLSLAFGAGAVYLVSGGHGVEGTFLGTIDLVSLVSVFVYVNQGSKRR